MCSICNLFKGDNLIPTLVVAFASFLVGLLVELVICKATCSCKNGKMGARPAAKAHPRAEKKPAAKGGDDKFEKRHPAPADGSIEIYVGNLSYDLTEDQLRKEFEAFGKVDAARVVTNKFNDKSKGFGFVVMPNRPEAEAAIAAMSEKEVLGRKMRVNEARNTLKDEA